MYRFKKIVVKIGTNVLTRKDGLLDITAISQLVDQVAAIKKSGVDIIVVSSGAVGAGRSMLDASPALSKVIQRQVFSSIGQIRLMRNYSELLANQGLYCAQVLATKEDFRDRTHYINMQNCFNALLRDNIIPIVNENDVVSVSELMFTDNDELAGLIASMINAEALIILSSVDGVLDGNPNDSESKVINEIQPGNQQLEKYIFPTRSSFGRGGMHTKIRIAQRAAKLGITSFIANGKRNGILLDILNNSFVGTRFPASGNLSSVKKWLAYKENDQKGCIVVNEGAEKALCSPEKISSLLPIGIVRIEGDFKKGDIVQISNEDKQPLGMGIAQYSAKKARPLIGLKNKKPLVHYDYLFIYG